MVYDVVVQQGGGMDILNQACQKNVEAPGVPGKAGAQNQKQRTNPLPAAAKNMPGDQIDQGDLRIQILADLVFDRVEFPAITFPNVSHPFDGTGFWAVWHGAILGEGRGIVKDTAGV